MNDEAEKLHAKLAALEKETANLRLGSIVTGRRYAEAQVSLKELTAISLTAARRAAVAVEKAVLATKKAASVAEQLAPQLTSGTEDMAAQRARKAVATSVEAAAAAAEAAVEAAAAAAAAAGIAVHTAEHESEKNALADSFGNCIRSGSGGNTCGRKRVTSSQTGKGCSRIHDAVERIQKPIQRLTATRHEPIEAWFPAQP